MGCITSDARSRHGHVVTPGRRTKYVLLTLYSNCIVKVELYRKVATLCKFAVHSMCCVYPIALLTICSIATVGLSTGSVKITAPNSTHFGNYGATLSLTCTVDGISASATNSLTVIWKQNRAPILQLSIR
uniref:Ig-like domain-containing protein n=1 Tax=Otarine gammaherpesvirus 4 TaxID=2801541 RepID=A0A889IW21_9GAMA|nr:hypothetical protein [Otarine gammaherpesvirus 4]